MSHLLRLGSVRCDDLGRAIARALEFRGRLPVVWIVNSPQSGYLLICQPSAVGGIKCPIAEHELEMYETFSPGTAPEITINFGPGVIPEKGKVPCPRKTVG